MTKIKKYLAIVPIITLMLVLCLTLGACGKKSNVQEPTAIMECKVQTQEAVVSNQNGPVHLMSYNDAETVANTSSNEVVLNMVLDQNNVVIAVNNNQNENSEILMAKANFKGKTADEASKLFVEVSTKLGYIKVDTQGTKVDVTIYADNEIDFNELSNKIEAKVNGYFDEMGMIAGVVTQKSTQIKEKFQSINSCVAEMADKTSKELLAMYTEDVKHLEGVAQSMQKEISAEFNGTLKKAVLAAEDALDKCEAEIERVQQQIVEFEKQIKDTAIGQSEIIKEQLNVCKKNLQGLQQMLKEKRNDYKAKVKEYNDTIEQKAQELRNASQQILENAKVKFDEKVTATEQFIKAHQKATEDAINAYRESLRQSQIQ